MKRGLFNLASVLSLLLCLAAAGFCIAGFWGQDLLSIRAGLTTVVVGSGRGQLILLTARAPDKSNLSPRHLTWEHSRNYDRFTDWYPNQPWARLGFGYVWNADVYGLRVSALIVPH